MLKKLNLLFIVFLLVGCDQDTGYVEKANLRAEEFSVKQTITSDQFQTLKVKLKEETEKGKNTILKVVKAEKLKDKDFHGLNASMLKISQMPHITNDAFSDMNLRFVAVEETPNIDEDGISKIKGLKSVQLWNMPHMTDEKAKVLLKKRIKVYDDRHKTHQKFRAE